MRAHSGASAFIPTCDVPKTVADRLPCVECGDAAHRLSDGREAYPHRPDLFSKAFWFCRCGAFVGCHPGSKTALGAPAGQKTKWARSDAHKVFDRLWKSGNMTRSGAYSWLADALGIASRDCHISHMDAATARRVIAACKARTPPSDTQPQSPTNQEQDQ